MPISPLRMSVMRGAQQGTLKGFQPIEKEVYSLASKKKPTVGLSGKIVKGTPSPNEGKTTPATKLSGGPAWQRKDQTKSTTSAPVGSSGTVKKQENGFVTSAAGNKQYGQSGRTAPNIGPTANKLGYAKRDLKLSAAKKIKGSYYDESRKAK